MNSLTMQLAGSFVLIIVTALVTYFFTNVSKKEMITNKLMNTFVTDKVKVHEQVNHPVNFFDYVKRQIDEHKDECPVAAVQRKVERVEKLVIWLVYSNNGDPKSIIDLEE